MLITVQFTKSNILLDTQFASSGMRLDAEFADFQKVTIQEGVDPYMGDYEITPKVDAQTMPTAQKYMTDDVRIKSIPFYETSNESDGKTVFIGTEVEIYGS